MSNDILSQEEIDALLNGSPSLPQEGLEDEDKDLLGEIGNICMGSAATTLSILINQPVSITTPKVKLTTLNQLKDKFVAPNISIEVKFSSGLGGANLLVLKVADAKIIADLMMGGEGKAVGEELSEIELSAVSEAMNQMIGTAATSMATMFKKEVNISPPNTYMWDIKTDKLSNVIHEEEKIVQVSFRLAIGDLIDSEIMQLLPYKTSQDIIESMTAGFKTESGSKPQTKRQLEPAWQEPPMQSGQYQASWEQPRQRKEEQVFNNDYEPIGEVEVHKAQFTSFENPVNHGSPRNIDLILDVPLEVSVILGKTKKSVKDVLDLTTGSLVELDKLVEEPVDILVNGKMVAQGEVVVVNENFGVRITNIISNVERVKGLQGR